MTPAAEHPSVSVIIPTWNGAAKIQRCLGALRNQDFGRPFEIVVVNDGSTDNTPEVLARYDEIRVLTQANAGPAAARNRGSRAASGDIIVFTDDDCEPMLNWLTEMIRPFADPAVVGAKGVYRTRQSSIIARFVQLEYEDRYRLLARRPTIDFIDTYSAAFRRDRFLEMGGYDTSFPVACAEDVELSYRMSARGWNMVFVPGAKVYHRHPDSLAAYLRKKFKFAFWRVLAVKKNPAKAIKDSHTPQLMKLQMLFAPALAIAVLGDLAGLSALPLSLIVSGSFILSALPFSLRGFAKDPTVALLSPCILAARSCSQFLGVTSGAWRLLRNSQTALRPAQS
jgi:glycosyltransferase involved in cell wall biosynthesis